MKLKISDLNTAAIVHLFVNRKIMRLVFFVLFFITPNIVSADLNTGLVGNWTFDGKDVNWATNSVTDKSGSGNTGAITNMSTTTSPAVGRVGQALDFGIVSNSHIKVTNDLLGTGDKSVCVWVYPNRSTGTTGYIISTGNIDNLFSIKISSARTISVSSDGLVTTLSGQTLTSNEWSHICVTRESSGTGTIYVNGVAGTPGSTGTPVADSGGVYIGNITFGLNRVFPGSIDEVRFYSRLLSAQEITQLYKQGQSKVSRPAVRPSTDALSLGLVGYWTMDGKDTNWVTNTMSDMSGNANNVVITDMSTSTSPVLGKIGQALKFDGSDDYLTKASFSALSMPITLSSWGVADLPADSTSDSYFSMVSRGGVFTDDSNFNMGVRRRNSSTDWRIFCYWRDGASNLGGGEVVIPVSGSSPISGWHHYSCVINSDGSVSAYFDGALAGTVAASVPFGTGAHALKIGSPVSVISTDKMWKGYLDETRIYNRALSAQEVSQLYKQNQAKVGNAPAVKPATDSLSQGLVAYFTLDGKHINWATNTASDITGNGHNATLVGLSTTTSPTIGRVGQALRFTASTNRLATPSSSATAFGTGDFSLSVWVKTSGYTNQGSGLNTIVARNFIGAASSYGIYYGSNNLPACRVDTGVATTGGTTLADGNWHHLVLVRRGDVVECWEDNTKLTDGSTTANLSGSTPIYIGNDNNSFLRGNNGPVDEVRLYNRSLSTQEIGQLFKLGRSKRK